MDLQKQRDAARNVLAAGVGGEFEEKGWVLGLGKCRLVGLRKIMNIV